MKKSILWKSKILSTLYLRVEERRGAVTFYCCEGHYAIKSAFYFILEYIFKIIVVPTPSPIFTNLIYPFNTHTQCVVAKFNWFLWENCLSINRFQHIFSRSLFLIYPVFLMRNVSNSCTQNYTF